MQAPVLPAATDPTEDKTEQQAAKARNTIANLIGVPFLVNHIPGWG